MVNMRLFQAADVVALTGLTRSQLREWSGRDRRNLVPPDIVPEGPGRHALFAWQTVLVLRLLKTLNNDFAVEVAAWAPGLNELRRNLEGISFPSLWGLFVYFPDRERPELMKPNMTVSNSGGLTLPLDPHLAAIATKLSIPPPEQLHLFPAIAVTL